MIQAIRQKVHVQDDGRLEILATELQEGMEADVIVLVQSPQSSEEDKTNFPNVNEHARLEAIAKAQEIVRRHVPASQSLVDELIVERRVRSAR